MTYRIVENNRFKLESENVQESESAGDSCTCFWQFWYYIRDYTSNCWSWMSNKMCPNGASNDRQKSNRRSLGKKRDRAIKKTLPTTRDRTTDSSQARRIKFKSSFASEPDTALHTRATSSSEPGESMPISSRTRLKSTYSTDRNRDEPMHSVRSKDRSSVISEGSQSGTHRDLIRSSPTPPKIEFVETGSIFGARNRHTTTTHVLLDDGRFKSPGQPNITSGPDGRAIRISFQTGFPSMKSLESRASLQSVKTVDSRRSLDQDGYAPNLPDLDPEPNET